MIPRKVSSYQATDAIALAPPRRVSPAHLAKALSLWLIRHWEWFLIATILIAAALLQGINMFHFPYYEDDEGTYMSQAWAIVKEGQLASYTYWYDHAPAGWILIALWTILSGGFHSFGPIIQSGRVLMLLMQLGSTYMVYQIGKGVSRSTLVASLAALTFALSPYGIYFHRRVLLDNITTFWMLLSILLLVGRNLTLKRVWLSALALGISILSKELTIFLVPALAYLVYIRADKSHRWFATVGWITLVGSIVSLYVLMAILKGELFPTGTWLGGSAPHVSLLGTLQSQMARGKDGGLLDLHSGFWQQASVWAQDDPLLVVGGSLCAIVSLFIKKRRLIGAMGITTLSLWAFLARGGEVIGFYLVPLLPLLALNIALVLGFAIERMRALLTGLSGTIGVRLTQGVVGVLFLTGMLLGYATSPDLGFKSDAFILWNSSQAAAQQQAVTWIEEHLPPDSYIIIDQSMWTDLHDNSHNPYAFAHYYWKVQDDPAIRDAVFHDNWRTVDYVVTTIQMLTDARGTNMPLMEAVIDHSTVIAHFDSGGWPIDIRRVDKG